MTHARLALPFALAAALFSADARAADCDGQQDLETAVKCLSAELSDTHDYLKKLAADQAEMAATIKEQREKIDAMSDASAKTADRVDALEKAEDAAEAEMMAQSDALKMMKSEYLPYMDGLMAYMKADTDAGALRIRGANLVVSPGEKSEGTGNIIIGDDKEHASIKGSSNLIVGRDHTVTSSGAIVGGQGNDVSGDFALAAGSWNEADGESSFAVGSDNRAAGEASSVSGGVGLKAAEAGEHAY